MQTNVKASTHVDAHVLARFMTFTTLLHFFALPLFFFGVGFFVAALVFGRVPALRVAFAELVAAVRRHQGDAANFFLCSFDNAFSCQRAR
jgi:hypothetical protein